MKNLFFKIISKRINDAIVLGKKIGKKIARKEFLKQLRQEKFEIKEDYERKVKDLKNYYEQIITEKEKEGQKTKKQMYANRNAYKQIRKREIKLDILSQDIEDISEDMIIKVQESIQPFLRFLSKMDHVKRSSDKKDVKISKILELSR